MNNWDHIAEDFSEVHDGVNMSDNDIVNWFKDKIPDTDEWISVKDELPNRITPVLIWTTISIYPALGLYAGDCWIYKDMNADFLTRDQPHVEVLYWQPLPTVPKQLLNSWK